MYEHERKWGPISLALVIAGGIVVGGIALSAAVWLLGMVAGLISGLLHIAVLIGLALAVVYGVRFVFRDHQRI